MLFEDYTNRGTLSLSVSDLNKKIKDTLENSDSFQDIWVSGELSNISMPASGHVYFTLKDNQSAIKCVMWKSSASRLRDKLISGSKVELHGRIGVYERDGIYQLYADQLRTSGTGDLYLEFERLKKKLSDEGLFSEERKLPIPAIPHKIGVITSSSGAALQDILNTLRGRWPLCQVILSPSSVQGAEAPGELCRALELLEKEKPDVILIARGGGSIEDLWAFNDEKFVRMVCECKIPVISGVGHETDFTLVDFGADLRAPTPTGAAALAVPDIQDITIAIDNLCNRLNKLTLNRLQKTHDDLGGLQNRLRIQSPLNKVRQEKLALSQTCLRLNSLIKHILEKRRLRVENYTQRLAALNPNAVLLRGYAMIENEQHIIVSSISNLHSQDIITIRMADGSAGASVQTVNAKKG